MNGPDSRHEMADGNSRPSVMPAVFIGHGSPMNAIEDTEFSGAWERLGRTLSRPEAILCISAHWETIGTRVTAMSHPRTIHDFGGFPKALFDVEYPAAGCPPLAERIRQLAPVPVTMDGEWGLDHGAWSVLCRMYPGADVPVVQLSLDRALTPARHYELGRSLGALRQEGVLIVGSGNIVHNLGALVWGNTASDWAVEFDRRVRNLILAGDHDALIGFTELGPAARLAVPTAEHFLPLLYILALGSPGEAVSFFAESVTLGTISMRSIILGALPQSFADGRSSR